MTREQCQQRQFACRIELGPAPNADCAIGVEGAQLDSTVVARGDLGVRAQADRRVQRRRAVVEQVQRPDVDGAAGEVDPGWRGRSQTHAQL
jgi:hypothetical protein